MIRKPFRTPMARKSDESVDIDRVSEPQAKKRRISSDKGNGVTTIGPQLVFKTPGVSSVPHKPFSAVKNPAVPAEPLDGGFDGYYNVLWYVYP